MMGCFITNILFNFLAKEFLKSVNTVTKLQAKRLIVSYTHTPPSPTAKSNRRGSLSIRPTCRYGPFPFIRASCVTVHSGDAENARPENDGQKNYGSGKCKSGK